MALGIYIYSPLIYLIALGIELVHIDSFVSLNHNVVDMALDYRTPNSKFKNGRTFLDLKPYEL